MESGFRPCRSPLSWPKELRFACKLGSVRVDRAESMAARISPEQWAQILTNQRLLLSDEDQAIVRLLSSGLTQKQAGANLGLNRSAVWRRARALGRLVNILDEK
jgi:DNA-binding NarL/FixJ family response regulator